MQKPLDHADGPTRTGNNGTMPETESGNERRSLGWFRRTHCEHDGEYWGHVGERARPQRNADQNLHDDERYPPFQSRDAQHNDRPLHEGANEVLKHVARLWGFGVHLESVNGAGEVQRRWSVTPTAE